MTATRLSDRFDFTLNYDVGYYAMPGVDAIRDRITSSNPSNIFKALETELALSFS